jgi:hypothetical protein
LRGIDQQAVIGVVDELAFLAFLHHLDGEAELLADLVVRVAVQIRHARVHIQHGGDLAQRVLAWLLFVIDERFGQLPFVLRSTVDGDGHVASHAVDAERAGFHRRPRQQPHQPARCDDAQRRDRLCRIGELSCGAVA